MTTKPLQATALDLPMVDPLPGATQNRSADIRVNERVLETLR